MGELGENYGAAHDIIEQNCDIVACVDLYVILRPQNNKVECQKPCLNRFGL